MIVLQAVRSYGADQEERGERAARRAAVLPGRGAVAENQNRTQGRVREQKRIFGDWGKLGK